MLSWLGILRLGLVQTALGAVVVLTTSTMNRIMNVELVLPALLPGFLVGLHYAVEVLRPRWGHGSDRSGTRTPWILRGIGILAVSGISAAIATGLMEHHLAGGIALGVLAFGGIGVGVGMAGTATLALLAATVAPRRRAAAGAIVWLMMIAGLAATATIAGGFLDPYSHDRLLIVTWCVAAVSILLALTGITGLERRLTPLEPSAPAEPFMDALKGVWQDDRARRLAIFVFVSMIAFSAQDLILEPYGARVYDMTVAETTKMAGMQHQGVFLGMVLAAVCLSGFRLGTVRGWVVAGCIGSAGALVAIAVGGFVGAPITPLVMLLGLMNGVFAVAAIGEMMGLAAERSGPAESTGTRMGVFGAAQAAAFGIGGFLGALAADIARAAVSTPETAYGMVFGLEACVFLVAAFLATRIAAPKPEARPSAAALVPGE